jgi:hypothetical protein
MDLSAGRQPIALTAAAYLCQLDSPITLFITIPLGAHY